MTTAHRPTFDPARGRDKNQAPTRAFHAKALPAHTQLKLRHQGQTSESEVAQRDLRAELLRAEAEHRRKTGKGGAIKDVTDDEDAERGSKRLLENGEEDEETAKRRKILEEARDVDAESEDSDSDESDSSESEDEDDTAALYAELAKIKAERAAEKARQEAESEAKERDERDHSLATGNPLLNTGPKDFNVKRRWDDDVIFKNQARGIDDKPKNRFVNDMLRSDFHKKFLNKYVK